MTPHQPNTCYFKILPNCMQRFKKWREPPPEFRWDNRRYRPLRGKFDTHQNSRTGFLTTPTIFRLVSKDLPRFLDRKQSFLRPERSLVRNIRENLGQQRLIIPLHHGVSIRNNEYVRAFDLCFQGKTNRLGRITGINVTPEIPFAFPGIILKPRESRIIMGFHDIRKTQPDNL